VLRACAAAAGVACYGEAVLASNDDSGCMRGDLCSRIQFTCPASGSYNVFTGAFTPGEAATCTLP
jgi:hypothetical protein